MASFFFFCLLVLLLLAQHGASSSHESYKLGSKQIFVRTPGKSSGNSKQATTVPPATTCSSIATGLLGKNKLPVVHQQSPCSPLHGLPSPTAADVLRRDASLVGRRFSSHPTAAAPAPSPAATIIPTNGSSYPMRTLPGVLLYSVLVSYGTPEQQLPFLLDTSSIGASMLRCKPCAKGSSECDPAFDTSRTSTFTHILCGSPDCPATNCTAGFLCPLDGRYSTIEGTFAKDVLTLAPSMAVDNFTFVCLDVHESFDDFPVAGTLDVSSDPNSLPSQLSSSGIAPDATFSYCLPTSASSQGFLSLGGGDATIGDDDDDDDGTAYAPLVTNGDPELASMYFIDLVGMSLGGEELPIPAGTFANNGTNLDVGTTFTMLTPDAYTPLRDSFLEQMSQYSNLSSPGIAAFDTCFNFTALDELVVPLVQLNFSNGDSFVIHGDQMLYYDDPDAGPFTVACLAFAALDAGDAFSAVIGTHSLASTEVVYDVAGGKVGFIPGSC